MKNFTSQFIVTAILAATPAIASAAWGTIESPHVLYTLGDDDIAQLKTAKTSDGKTFLSWLQWSDHTGWGFDVHLQLIDNDGNPVWDNNGILVETHRNASWNAAYSLVVSPDGDAIISWADEFSSENESIEYADNMEPVIYRVNQNGEHVWGDDGMRIDNYKYPPILHTVGDDLYAVLIGKGDYDPYNIVRINDDGSFAFPPVELNARQIVQSSGSDFIAVYSAAEGTVAMRFDRDIKPVWDKPAIVSEHLYTGYNLDPYRIKSDGNGGVAVSFSRALDFTHLPIVQHISADGEPTFGLSADVIPEENMIGDYNYPAIGINPDTETILTVYSHTSNVLDALGGQLFDYFGERMWGDDAMELTVKNKDTGYPFSAIDLEPLNDNEWLICYSDEQGWAENILHIASFDNDGNEIWDVKTPMSISLNEPYFSFSDGIVTLFYINKVTDENWNTTCSIENIRFDTNTVGIKDIEEAPRNGKKEYFSIDGTRLFRPSKGINIVRNGDGSVSKVMVK